MIPENENVTTMTEEESEVKQGVTVTQTTEESENEEPSAPTMPINGVVANCAKLNVRETPNIDAPVLCILPRGTSVLVNEEESTDKFYKVYSPAGNEGFCMKRYITI